MTTHRKTLDNILTTLKGLIAESEADKKEAQPSYIIEGEIELDAVFAALTKAIDHKDFKRSPELVEAMRKIRLDLCELLGEDPEDYK